MNNHNIAFQQEFFQDREVSTRFSMGRSTIWRMAKNGRFPRPVRLGPGITRWRRTDLEEWMKDPSAWTAQEEQS